MNLHEDKELFRNAVKITAQQINIPEIYIEKDYWVTYALYTIFNHTIGNETIFKGGTALVKCFGMITRFSEDIDLVVLRREGESNNKLSNKIKTISKVVTDVLPEIDIAEITQKMGMNRKTAHTYTKEFGGDFGQVRDVIIVEATWLGYYEPYTYKAISSFVYEMMQKTGQLALAENHGMLPFEVRVLEPKRTMCEKIMSLVRFSHTEKPIEDLKNKIRHCYDLHQLLQDDELLDFFRSNEFDEMLLKVANDDVNSFKNNNTWLRFHPTEALIFAETETVWKELVPTYLGRFQDLVFGDFPKETAILTTLNEIKTRLSSVEWTIKIANPA
jgi:hypothetical protein